MAASPKPPGSVPVHIHSFFGLLGIDGPAAFLKPEAPGLESKPHVLSVGSPASEEATDGSAGGESPPVETASKPDLQEILQKHGEGDAQFMAGCASFSLLVSSAYSLNDADFLSVAWVPASLTSKGGILGNSHLCCCLRRQDNEIQSSHYHICLFVLLFLFFPFNLVSFL